MAITGLTPSTPSKLLLDAGAFYKDYDLSQPYSAQAAKLLGATAGGGAFSAVPSVRKIEVDGAKENVKELQTIDGWVVTMTANVKEVTAQAIQTALGAASASTSANKTTITGKADFESSDYASNLTWVGRLSGSSDPVIIVVDNALCLNGLSLTMADKAEAVVPITVTGHYSLSDLDTPPFKVIYPE